MTLSNPPALNPSFVARVKGILTKPTAEWHVIDGERPSIKSLFTGYAAILAAIGPVAGLIGGQLFPLFGLRTPIVSAIIIAAFSYVMALVGAYVLGLIIEALAPSFGAVKDRTKAMQLAVYSSTASWLAGIFTIIPALAILAIVGLYSLFLLFRGLPILTKVPEDKALVYTIVIIVAAFVVFAVIGLIVGAITSSLLVTAGAVGGLGGYGL